VQQDKGDVATTLHDAAGAADDWEKEVDPGQQRLQGYVERLQDKGDKEVARIIKVCTRRDFNTAEPKLTLSRTARQSTLTSG
jgi:hypothetical protein